MTIIINRCENNIRKSGKFSNKHHMLEIRFHRLYEAETKGLVAATIDLFSLGIVASVVFI